jgi:hypothetical protein
MLSQHKQICPLILKFLSTDASPRWFWIIRKSLRERLGRLCSKANAGPQERPLHRAAQIQ